MRRRIIRLIILILFAIAVVSIAVRTAQAPDGSIAVEAGASPAADASAPPTDGGEAAATPAYSRAPSFDDEEILALMETLTLRERVEQLFFVAVRFSDGGSIVSVTEEASAFLSARNPGGYILFRDNIETPEQVRELTDGLRALSAVTPFIGIDEEGGSVSRLSGLSGYEKPESAKTIAQAGDPDVARQTGEYIGATLQSLGINVNFAPDADVLTTSHNSAIGDRSYGSDPATVTEMAAAFQAGLHSQGILTSPKHFPGHGGTVNDPHRGSATSPQTNAQFRQTAYPPFIRLIEEGAEFIMMGHFSSPNADPSGLPASLSRYFVTDVLRDQLGFTGIIITDSCSMGAITSVYSSASASVQAFEAGVDMVLMPADYDGAVNGVLKAIEDGILSEEQLQTSLYRVLLAKKSAGML